MKAFFLILYGSYVHKLTKTNSTPTLNGLGSRKNSPTNQTMKCIGPIVMKHGGIRLIHLKRCVTNPYEELTTVREPHITMAMFTLQLMHGSVAKQTIAG